MSGTPLPEGSEFNDFRMLFLDERGSFIRPFPGGSLDTGDVVGPRAIGRYLDERIGSMEGVTDVFVWVHGWQNDTLTAAASAARLFSNILAVRAKGGASAYPAIGAFRPKFLAVAWPSKSLPERVGYKKIRDRAAAMTNDGDAEFFLASLLGYFDAKNARDAGPTRDVLRSKGGFYVHCVGHSFGGRFLTAAVRAAATPSARTLSLAREGGSRVPGLLGAAGANGFAYTVDSLTVFQMAAPSTRFGDELRTLADAAPISGPVVLTHSSHDRANCVWHRAMELERAIGCVGALEPAELVTSIALAPANVPYVFASKIVNVDASDLFVNSDVVTGAHSNFWFEESIHLVLSAVNASR